MIKRVGFLAFASAMVGVLLMSVSANAAIVFLQATLTGAQETPPSATNAAGVGLMAYDTVANTFTLHESVQGISLAAGSAFNILTNSHIHAAPPGVPGPIIVPFGGPAVWTEPQTGFIELNPLINQPFPAANVADLLAGNTYLNVHSNIFPGGEIRGQLIPVAVPEPASLGLLSLAAASLGLRRRRA